MTGDLLDVSCRLLFNKIGRTWSLDSSKRSILISSESSIAIVHYHHVRQKVGTSEVGLELLHSAIIGGYFYVVNRGSSGVITFGFYGQTHMFKLKPGEPMLARKITPETFGVISTEADTPVDVFLLGDLNV